MKRINYRMNKLLSIIISVILLMVLTSCEQNPITNKYEPPPDEDVSGVSQFPVTEDTFTSDYLPGEENAIGNIWTNQTFCRQGNYIYHFNEAERCLQKWSADEGINNAKTICYVDTSMIGKRPNHIEVIGDYIYLCLLSGESRGNCNLTSIIRIRSDGNEQSTLATDCANCQFRIVNNTLFYLTVMLDQQDLSTQDYYIAINEINLLDIDTINPDADVIASRISGKSSLISFGESAGGGYNPVNFFVIVTENQYIIGYKYPSRAESYIIRYDVVRDGDQFSVINEREATGDYYVRYPKFDGQILVSHVDTTIAVDTDSWPDAIQDGTLILSKGKWLGCLADNMVFYKSDVDGIWMLDLLTGEEKKINNDDSVHLEYVGDGKIYYYASEMDSEYHWYTTLCSCNIDGTSWEKIYSVKALQS